jgi:hypothetical protein
MATSAPGRFSTTLTDATCFFALDPSSADAYDAPVAFFGGANLRAASLDGEIVCAEEVLKIEPASALVAAVASRGTEEVKNAIAGHHAEALREAYLDGRRIDEALFHRDAYMRVGGQGGPSNDNNVAYLSMALGFVDDAITLLSDSRRVKKSGKYRVLMTYNTGPMKC